MLWSFCWSRVRLNRQPPRRKTKDSIFPGGGIAWGTTTSQTTPETRGFWSPVSSECHEGGGVASIAGDWWRRGRQPLVFWYRSTAIRAELEVGDEGEDDDRRFSVLLVSSMVELEKTTRDEMKMLQNTSSDNATATTPLLEEDRSRGGGCSSWWRKVLDVEEAKTQVLISLPMILTNVFYYAIPLVSVMFSGHLGHLELAGATLANSWAIITGFALMVTIHGLWIGLICGLFAQTSTLLLITFCRNWTKMDIPTLNRKNETQVDTQNCIL
ncbi:hypothetical protein EZV62_008166 [Acer yangbiense]|uniref:Protein DETOXIFICATION n=1 Tax=Acer yangbiense TaxID=1000413 RepID=A0A5C7ICL3_9ROSI|nr:hypothetical protein EZV62_008166 [Acer yangbiense]